MRWAILGRNPVRASAGAKLTGQLSENDSRSQSNFLQASQEYLFWRVKARKFSQILNPACFTA
jgi:hypothetical protein